MSRQRRATLVGTGLIGGSIGLALRRQGWLVAGVDQDKAALDAALDLGAIDSVGVDPASELGVVATPVGATAAQAAWLLAETDATVTDVGSVKAPVVAAVHHARFVGGHPMAGSEQVGLAGARADLFEGATWVLTPTVHTDPGALALAHSVATSLGAEVLTLEPERHDLMVAMVSHVPHLTAATLMSLAARRSLEQRTILRLAAGGFRDMTRVAAGHPGIWPDICADNRQAILEVLDDLVGALSRVRGVVDRSDREELLDLLEGASLARRNLPVTAARPEELAELRVSVHDRPGELAVITALATELAVNIYDIEIAHSAERPTGVVILVVGALEAAGFQEALAARGYPATSAALA